MAEEKATKLAVASRLIVLLLQLLANAALPDHNPDVFRAVKDPDEVAKFTWLDKLIHNTCGGLRHWDGEYFLHIAQHSYSYENTLAFYPLYPMIVRHVALFLHYFGFGISLSSWILLVAVILNVFFFCKATNAVYALTLRIFNDPNKSWYAALLFCFNPASIFFTAAYSEALFCWLTFAVMLECCEELRSIRVIVPLALSFVTRSNGLLNAGYLVYFVLRKVMLKQWSRFMSVMKLIICLICACAPLTFFNFNAFMQFCLPDAKIQHPPEIEAYAQERDYILAGARQPENSSWCENRFPVPYSYIQSHYWDVGFLRYYQLKQLPNFVLALPILAFLYYHCFRYVKHMAGSILPSHRLADIIKQYKSVPFVLHSLFLVIFCTLFVHVQVSTRLLCSASPCLYWFAADYMPKSLDQIKLRSHAGIILLWFAVYYVAGTVAFSNNLPWT